MLNTSGCPEIFCSVYTEFLHEKWNVMSEETKIMEERWDCLVVLDACRYDYFSNMYEDYFSGKLRKGISVGSNTPEWCERSFPDQYSDVIYVSGNPYINSRWKIEGFDARRHFFKVVDVWDFGWSEDLSSVHPVRMNQFALPVSKRFPEKRLIIHYLQPHEPYLSARFSVKEILRDRYYKNGLEWARRYWHDPLEKLMRASLVRTGIMKNTWGIREALNLPPSQPMDAVRRKYGISGLREAYRENLRIVLGHVAELCGELLTSDLRRRIVITSDHGELLGEDGDYCHKRGSRDSNLVEIPVFELDNVEVPRHISKADDAKVFTRADEKSVRARLRALGYID